MKPNDKEKAWCLFMKCDKVTTMSCCKMIFNVLTNLVRKFPLYCIIPVNYFSSYIFIGRENYLFWGACFAIWRFWAATNSHWKEKTNDQIYPYDPLAIIVFRFDSIIKCVLPWIIIARHASWNVTFCFILSKWLE